ncbi:putative receptor-like protein kinase [Tanacetum coccineum]
MDLDSSIFQLAKASIESTQLLYVEETSLQKCVKVVSVTPLLSYRAYVSSAYPDKDESAKTSTTMNQFNQALLELMDKLRNDTKIGGQLRKFATGNIRGPDFKTIYGLMQCTPDITEVECNVCTGLSIRFIPDNFNYSWGGKVVSPFCYLEYHLEQFFNDSIPLSNTPSSSSLPLPPGKKNNTTQIVTIVIVTMAFVGVTIIASLCILKRLKNKKKQKTPPMPTNIESMDIGTVESFRYDFSAVQIATNNFSEENKLGQGGFGAVYKGELEDGQKIAVKRLANNSGQGDPEFKNEVLLVAKLQHRNLVRLLGFSIHGNERLLVYELLPNASLDQFIFDPIKRALLDWKKRYKIIKGIAKGLLYLHEDSPLKIIHRDMKASNVLLDGEMNAKIADFGLARLFKQEESQADTSRIVGTHAYMAPEYLRHGQFSVKTDVFSFGVLVLEMIAGQRNHCFQNGETIQNLLSYAWKRWKNGTPSDMIDLTLNMGSAGSLQNIIRSIHIGLLCVQENVTDRPTMDSIVLMLSSLTILLPQPSEPAFLVHSIITDPEMPLPAEYSSSSGSSCLERPELSMINLRPSLVSVNDVTISEIVPR